MKEALLNKIAYIIILITVFLFPLFFLPLTTEFYFFNKKILLIVATSLLYLLWAVKSALYKKITVKKDPLALISLVLALAFWLSSLLVAPNKISSISGETGLITTLVLFYIALTNFLEAKQVKSILAGLLLSSFIVAWLNLFSFLNLFKQLNFGPEWLQSQTWTPMGSTIIILIFMINLLPLSLVWAFKNQENTEKVLLFLASALQLISVAVTISLFINKSVTLAYLSPQFGWSIVLEGFKNFKTALLGAGPDNFLAVFTRFRPAGLNTTSLWNMRFASNSNLLFQLLSTVGLLGTAIFIWLITKFFYLLKTDDLLVKITKIGLISTLVLQLIISSNLISLFLLFLFGALASVLAPKEVSEIRQPTVSLITAGLVSLVMGLSLYGYYQVWRADYLFRQSLLAASQNKGIDTYNAQIAAIKANPYVESYRVAYSQTNFALANSLAQKKDLSDQDRQNVSRLVDQAIREAKAAAGLNPQLTDNWVNLANLYRNLVDVADGASSWAIASYNQAILTDPTNALLRVDYGGVFFTLKDYERAIEQFKMAVNLKPDYANAYYNLAAAYRAKQDWAHAYENMQMAINLVKDDSSDKQKATKELDELKAKLPSPAPQASAAPAPTAEQQLSPPPSAFASAKPGFRNVKLPESAGPDVSPIPEASASATPQPSIK